MDALQNEPYAVLEGNRKALPRSPVMKKVPVPQMLAVELALVSLARI